MKQWCYANFDKGYSMSTSIKKRRFLFTYPLLAGLLILHAIAAPDEPFDPLAPPSLVQVQTQIETVKNDATLDDAQRKTILQNLQQTSENLERAQAFEDSMAEFVRLIQQAPAGIEAIKQELNTPADPIHIKPDPSKSVSDWEEEFLQATADANAARKKLADLEAEDTKRSSQRSEFPDLLSAAKVRQIELTDRLSAPTPSTDTSNVNPLLAQSVQWALRSELAASKTAAAFYGQQVRDNNIYREWLAAQRDRTARKLSAANALANALQIQIGQQRQIESDAAAAQAEKALEAASRLHPCVQSIADRNAALAALRAGENGLTKRLRNAYGELQEANALAATILTRKDELEQRIEAAGLTQAVAQLLRRGRDRLPDMRRYHSRIRERRDTIAGVQLNLLDLNDERATLLDIESKAAAIAAAHSTTEQERTELAALLTTYLTAQRDQLNALIA
ncbi:MAG TPA: hypothetical protein VLL07_00245, partial [Pontiella sp.]|nr:hypothetical protein [Pontiella sp.]